MSRLIDRIPTPGREGDTLYPVEIPGHVWPRRFGNHVDQATLYFTAEQLVSLRSRTAQAILKVAKKVKGDS
jgi:hypothetical protein